MLITKYILWFVTCRKNLHFDNILIKLKNNNDKYNIIGKLHLNHVDTDYYIEDVKYIQERIVPFEKIEPVFKSFLEYISSDKVYSNHIPYNSRDMCKITPSRFILIMAAFEWDFKVLYGDVKYETNIKYREAKDDVIEKIELLKNENTGKKRNYISSFLKFITNSGVSLSEKLTYAYKQNEEILQIFMDRIYKTNGIQDYTISDIVLRLQTQRNNYAHGNIDKEVDGLVIIDVLTVEWLLYVMKLSSFGLSKLETQKIINRLFEHNIHIE